MDNRKKQNREIITHEEWLAEFERIEKQKTVNAEEAAKWLRKTAMKVKSETIKEQRNISVTQLANSMGVNRGTVLNYIHRLNLKLPQRIIKGKDSGSLGFMLNKQEVEWILKMRAELDLR